MLAVSDSTPLIHLAKINKINYLQKLFEKVFIPKEVYNEIIRGKDQSKKEVALIEGFFNSFITVKEVSTKINLPSLHLGELKAMSLCKELKIKNFLIDEKEGFDSAQIFGLNPLRTTSLLLILLDKKIIGFDEYEKSLLNLSQSGYFLSAETYNLLLKSGKNLKIH